MGGFMFEAHQLGQTQVLVISVRFKSYRSGECNEEELARYIMHGGGHPAFIGDENFAEHVVNTNGFEFSVFSEWDRGSNGTWVWTGNYRQKQLVHDLYSGSTTPAHRFLGLVRDVFLPAEIAAADRNSRNGEWARDLKQALLTMLDENDGQSSTLTFATEGTKSEVGFVVRGSLKEVMRAIKEAAKLCN